MRGSSRQKRNRPRNKLRLSASDSKRKRKSTSGCSSRSKRRRKAAVRGKKLPSRPPKTPAAPLCDSEFYDNFIILHMF